MGLGSVDIFFVALGTITALDWLTTRSTGKKMKPFPINAMASVIIASILGAMY